MTFRPRAEHELYGSTDDQLIAYLREARAAGDLVAARRALALLVYGYEPIVRRRLAMKVPAHVVEDVAHDALVRAIAAAFDGSSQGQFRSWLQTIVDRTAADYYRRAERRPQEVELPNQSTGEGAWSREPSVASEAGAVELRLVVDQVVSEFSERHQRVIELHVFGGLPARKVSEQIEDMSEDNVAQIASRFRAALRQRLNPDNDV